MLIQATAVRQIFMFSFFHLFFFLLILFLFLAFFFSLDFFCIMVRNAEHRPHQGPLKLVSANGVVSQTTVVLAFTSSLLMGIRAEEKINLANQFSLLGKQNIG